MVDEPTHKYGAITKQKSHHAKFDALNVEHNLKIRLIKREIRAKDNLRVIVTEDFIVKQLKCECVCSLVIVEVKNREQDKPVQVQRCFWSKASSGALQRSAS